MSSSWQSPDPNGVIMVCGDAKNALDAEVANLEVANFDMTEVSTTIDEVTPTA